MADRDRSLPRVEALKYGTEMLDLGDITLREKQYEVLKLLVVEKKDVFFTDWL